MEDSIGPTDCLSISLARRVECSPGGPPDILPPYHASVLKYTMPWQRGKPRAQDTKQCSQCLNTFPRTSQYFRMSLSNTRLIKSKYCRPCARIVNNAYTKKRDAEYKRIAIEHYGGHCECCNESQIEFLTFDHVDGSGRHIRATESLGRKTAQWAIKHKFPSILRILCWNCHMAQNGNRPCPHTQWLLVSIVSVPPGQMHITHPWSGMVSVVSTRLRGTTARTARISGPCGLQSVVVAAYRRVPVAAWCTTCR